MFSEVFLFLKNTLYALKKIPYMEVFLTDSNLKVLGNKHNLHPLTNKNSPPPEIEERDSPIPIINKNERGIGGFDQ